MHAAVALARHRQLQVQQQVERAAALHLGTQTAECGETGGLVHGDKLHIRNDAHQFRFSLPITHVKRVRGHASCSARKSGTTWQVSPMADNRRRQTFSGASMESSE
jgi:hypothetical protein